MNDFTLLAHNYVRPEVQQIADFTGDSLELAKKAQEVDAGTIVFAGVDFMAEMAAILNPDRDVIHPDPHAKCAMALRIRPSDILETRRRYPDAEVVTYINSSAAIKAVSDIICTSSNAVKIVNSMDADTIIFAPDQNLAAYVAEHTRKELIPVPALGCCPVHHALTVEDIGERIRKYPEAEVIVHPETTPGVQRIADFIGSTSAMIRYVRESKADTILVGTEHGIISRMKLESPGKRIIPASMHLVCPDMKMCTVDRCLQAVKEHGPIVHVDKEVAADARRALERMLEVT